MTETQLLTDMLRKCREQFAYYAKNHRAKVPDLALRLASCDRTKSKFIPDGIETLIADTLAKAAVNEQMVKQIDALIGAPPGTKLPDNLADNAS